MANLKGINFDIDIDTQLSELKYLHSMDLIYDDYTVKVNNVYYNNDYDFAIFTVDDIELNNVDIVHYNNDYDFEMFTVDGIELHNVDTINSCEFVFSFDECKLYKLTDTIFICISYMWREDNRNPVELFNKFKEHIN